MILLKSSSQYLTLVTEENQYSQIKCKDLGTQGIFSSILAVTSRYLQLGICGKPINEPSFKNAMGVFVHFLVSHKKTWSVREIRLGEVSHVATP